MSDGRRHVNTLERRNRARKGSFSKLHKRIRAGKPVMRPKT